MANEFVARNGIIANANSRISGTLDVSGNITTNGNGVIHSGNIGSQSVYYASIATQVVTLQDTPPTGVDGKLWWETDTGKLKVYYGSSSAWVDALPMPDMTLYLTTAGGAITGDLVVEQTLTVVGNLQVDSVINAGGGTSTQWNTAYSWGNHASQGYATQTYVNTAIANLVDSAPSTLDTLNELAAALGDDPNFATTVTNSIATKLPLAGGTMTGQILTPSIGTGVYDGAIQLREYAYVNNTQTAWGYSPAITFHWGNITVKRFGMRSDGQFAIDDAPIALQSWVTSQGYQSASTAITTSNIGSQSVSVARQLLSPNNGDRVAADDAMPNAGNSFIHTLALGPGNNDGHILGMTWNGTSVYGAQIFLDTDPNDIMAIRSRSSAGVWTDWKTIIHSGTIGSQSVNYATTAGTANAVAWTNVSSRPTSLSEFTNNLTSFPNRIEFQYSSDRYSQAWRNSSTGAYWWVTTDDDKLGYHRNGDGDKFYFSNGGDFWSATNGWLSTALAAKQNASTAITTSNIGSQSVNYASSSGNADTLDGYHASAVGNRHFTARGFYVDGDENTYYPVIISGSAAYAFNRYSIYRHYGSTAPWDPIGTGAHKGGLTFDFEWSGDPAWGGNDHTLRVVQFSETYTTMVAGLALPVTHGVCVWLRGGHAYYEIQVDGYPVDPTVYIGDFTAGNGAVFSPRTDTSNVTSEIYGRMPVRNSSEVYDSGNRVITTGNIGSQSVSYATTAGNADTVDSLHASSFVRNDVDQPTVRRHFDASTTWTNDATTLFLGWYGGKVVIGNNNDGMHDAAAAEGNNSITLTNTTYSFKQTYMYHDGSLKLYMGSDGTRNTGWAYHTDNGTGLHWPNNGWHFMPYNSSHLRLYSGSSTEVGLRFETAGTLRGYVYADSGNAIGFLNSAGSWSLQITDSKNATLFGNRFDIAGAEGQISFKDSANTWTGTVGFSGNEGILSFPGRNVKITSGYNGTIELNTGTDGYNDGVINIPYGRLNVVRGYVSAPIYYDGDNGAYYLDPNSLSNLYHTKIARLQGGKTAFNVLEISPGDTPAFIKIRTTIPFSYGAGAWSVYVKGFVYGNSRTLDLHISWHTDGSNNAFYSTAITSRGSFTPRVRLARENDNVVIVLNWNSYWPKLYVEAYNAFANDYYFGWDWVDEDVAGDKVSEPGIYYAGNFNDTNISNWNTAHSWGNHAGLYQPLENQRLSTSNNVTFNQVYSNNWFRNNAINTGLYQEAGGGNHWYAEDSNIWTIGANGSTPQIRFRSGGHQGTIRGSVYADTSNQIGFLHNGGGWNFRTTSDKNAFVHGQTLTINADNAGWSSIYMNDGDEGMRELHCNSNRIGFLTQAGAWGAYADDSANWFATGYMQSFTSMYSPIYYDGDDSNYYLDPNGTSNLLKLSDRTMGFNGMNPMSASSPYESRYNASVNYRTGSMGYDSVDLNAIGSNWGSGFIDSWSSPANQPNGSTSHWVGFQSIHYGHQDSSNFYGFQMVSGADTNRFYVRASWPSPLSWLELVTSGNIGSQSVNYATSSGNSSTTSQRDFNYLSSRNINIGSWQTYHVGTFSASATQARRFLIAKIGIDYNDWNSVGMFEVELAEQYYFSGARRRYVVNYGYGGLNTIHLVEANGVGTDSADVIIEGPTQVSGDQYFLSVYVRVRYYSTYTCLVRTTRSTTSSNPPGIGQTVIFTDPAAENIGDFSINTTVYSTSGQYGVAAPIYRDSDDTNYYVDPNGASKLNGLHIVSSGNQASGYDASLYIGGSNDDWGITIGKGSYDYGINVEISPSATYAYNSPNFRVSGAGAVYSPIYYDANDTNYFVDPNSYSKLYKLQIGGSAHTNEASEGVILMQNNQNNHNYIVSNGAGWGSWNQWIRYVDNYNTWRIGTFDENQEAGTSVWRLAGRNRAGNSELNYIVAGPRGAWGDEDRTILWNPYARYDGGSWDGDGTHYQVITGANIASQSVSYATTAGRAYPKRSDGADINFYWDGQNGQPTWLWGSNDGQNFYVWNPSNFSVSYASSAGSASSATSATQVVTIQDTPPAGSSGKLWWESDTGKLKVYYGTAWVDASPIPDMSVYYSKAGGTISGDVVIEQTLTVVGNTLIQGALTETSDARLKENVAPLQDSLDKVLKLNGVSFNKIDTPNVQEIGFIAQEVEEVLPELVTETDEGIKTVSYSRVTAVLVETIKEQQAQIDELKALVNTLSDKLNNL